MNLNPLPQVYFLRPVRDNGPIKVGYSASVRSRLRDYNKFSPIELEIAATLDVPKMRDGRDARFHGEILERRFHARYADHRLHHEWFAAHALLLADIEAILAGTFDSACLPDPFKRTIARSMTSARHPQRARPCATVQGRPFHSGHSA